MKICKKLEAVDFSWKWGKKNCVTEDIFAMIVGFPNKFHSTGTVRQRKWQWNQSIYYSNNILSNSSLKTSSTKSSQSNWKSVKATMASHSSFSYDLVYLSFSYIGGVVCCLKLGPCGMRGIINSSKVVLVLGLRSVLIVLIGGSHIFPTMTC